MSVIWGDFSLRWLDSLSVVRYRRPDSFPAGEPATMAENLLYYGDNLDVLRRHIKDESVDLVYLDPPFNSNQAYNVLFKSHGEEAAAQIQAFEDTWHWDEAAVTAFRETVEAGGEVAEAMLAFQKLVGGGQGSDMLAYLSMMAPRLVELRRTLKPTGSLYLHCDPVASHYLKVLLDAIFGPECFRSEIIWKRSSAHSDTKQGRKIHGHIHDVILFYAKGEDWTWNPIYTPYDESYIEGFYRYTDPDTGRRYRLDNLTGPGGAAKGNARYEVMGVTRYWRYTKEKMAELIKQGRVVQTKPGGVPAYKRYLDEMPGVPLQDVWTDIRPIGAQAAERLGYPTQKPEALLERIIESSSNEGDTVLDPFCGCGTTVSAAQKLKRRWVGIDITIHAVALIEHRLRKAFKVAAKFTTRGIPTTIEEATALAERDKFQFQSWVVYKLDAGPEGMVRKGPDLGIDGRLRFRLSDKEEYGQAIISVKGGHLKATDVRDLRGVVDREKAEIGVLVSLEEPSRQMRAEAASAGFYTSPWGKHARIQLLTVGELIEGKQIDCPRTAGTNVTLKAAQPVEAKDAEELHLFEDNEGDDGPSPELKRAPRPKGKKRD